MFSRESPICLFKGAYKRVAQRSKASFISPKAVKETFTCLLYFWVFSRFSGNTRGVLHPYCIMVKVCHRPVRVLD